MPKPGVTIIEVIVVVGVIAVLLGLLLPAIQSIRASARDTACTNNLRQFNLALEQVLNTSPGLPVWEHEPGTAGGWSVAVIPYLDPGYGGSVFSGMNPASIPDPFRLRPTIFTCPAVPATAKDFSRERMHYVLTTNDHRRDWLVSDAPIDAMDSWLAGVEMEVSADLKGPHRGGFNQLRR